MTCTTCDSIDWNRHGKNEDYNDGWRDGMAYAHHAHEGDTYYGHQSANGVLGSGPDDVIVDGDWLHELETKQ